MRWLRHAAFGQRIAQDSALDHANIARMLKVLLNQRGQQIRGNARVMRSKHIGGQLIAHHHRFGTLRTQLVHSHEQSGRYGLHGLRHDGHGQPVGKLVYVFVPVVRHQAELHAGIARLRKP